MGKLITVDFRDDTIFAVERDDGIFVAVTPICKALGVSANMQRERIQNDPILSEGRIVTIPPSVGGSQETVCLRLDLLNGWLFTIDESRVKDEDVRQKVLTYKRECYSVLFKHFFGKSVPATVDEDEAPQESETTKIRLVHEGRQVFGNAAAAQLWFRLGLPVVPAMIRDDRQAEMFSYTAIKVAPDKPAEDKAA